MNKIPELPQPFADMRASASTSDDAYLNYWRKVATEGNTRQEDERVDRILRGLTRVALRGAQEEAEYTNRLPALQARYWYRTLGPLNTLEGSESDLITAVGLMSQYETIDSESERQSTKLDYTYALTDLARITENPQTCRTALSLAANEVKGWLEGDNQENLTGSERIRLNILQGDLEDMTLRFLTYGTTSPSSGRSKEKFREFEAKYAMLQMRNIKRFDDLINADITDENFGMVLEYFYILARRSDAFSNEVPESVTVRGATSREDAEWTGEDSVNYNRVKGNHDIVVTTLEDGKEHTSRVQTKTVTREQQQYHRDILVLDYEAISSERFRNIDAATSRLQNAARKMFRNYQEAYSS